ncbi:MAG: hypothetical protein HZC43_10165 [Nitrosomonadales bacterium]|nr:hypothetical protein [Nitrosomonadales bacterium]
MAHDRAFIVAGAQGADLLGDLRGAVDEAVERGTGLEAFRKNFKRIVAERGWTGWTGEGTKGGEAWRTKVIYQTNMDTSYAAGRWKQLNDPALLKVLPYWQYHHNDSVTTPRPLHVSWDGLTLPPDHPFWKLHYPPQIPPNWGCKCRVSAVSKEKYMLAIAGGKGRPPTGWEGVDAEYRDPDLVARGWNFAPGANATRPLKDFIDQKLIKLDASIGAAIYESMRPVLALERQLMWDETLDRWLAKKYADGEEAVVGSLSTKTLRWLKANNKPVPLTAEIAINDHLPDGAKQARHELAQNGLTLDEWRRLPAVLDRPGAIYFDTHRGRLVFVAENLGPEKVILEFDPKKLKGSKMNLVIAAFRIDDATIAGNVKGGVWELVEVSGR